MKGYLAITSAIILSGILILAAIGLSFSSYFNLSDISDSNLKETSYFLAEACSETALLKLAQDANYGGNENISVASGTCSILPMESSSTQKIIKTSAVSRTAATKLKVTVEGSPLKIVFWEEY